MPLTLLIAVFGPLSGYLSAGALMVALVGAAVGRGPRFVAAALVLAGVLVLWSEAQPSGGRVGALVAGMILFVGIMALWTFDSLNDRLPSGGRVAALVVGCGAMTMLSPNLAFKAKVRAFSPLMEAEAQRLIDSQPVTEKVYWIGCREPGTVMRSGPAPRSRTLGPFSFDCVFVIGTEDRPEVVFTSYKGTVYQDHASGVEFSGLIYAPAGSPLEPPVHVDEPYCLGHVAGDWYQFVQGSFYGVWGGCPSGETLIGTQ